MPNKSCCNFSTNNLNNLGNRSFSYRIQKKIINVKDHLIHDSVITSNYFNYPNKELNVKGFRLKTESNQDIVKKKFEDCNRLLSGINKSNLEDKLKNDSFKWKNPYKYSSSHYKSILPSHFYNRCHSPSQKYLVSDLDRIKGKFLIQNNKLINRVSFTKKLNPKEDLRKKEAQEMLNYLNWK